MRQVSYIIILVLLLNSNGFSQNNNVDFIATERQDDWGFAIAPYVLFADQATDVGGEKIRQSFNDLTSITNSGFQVIAGIRYKKIYFTFDGTFANLGFDDSNKALDLKLEIDQNILDFRLGYVVYENFKFDETEILKGWSLEINSGAKYCKNNLLIQYHLNIGEEISIDDEIIEPQDWWDWMIGAKMRFILSKKVLLGVSLSGGGFGIGNSTEFSYDFTYSNSFVISKLILINAGFRSFKYDRIDGVAENEIKTTVNVVGPLIGVTFRL